MKSQRPTPLFESRAAEKGAALITAVLLSLLLLAAGGTLILTTTMTGITAHDSTAEMQAYYAAEAGVAKTLEVLRGNLQSNPAGTRASFRNVLCSPNLWATTSGATVNVSADASSSFRVSGILDPDNQDSATKCAQASYKPDRLRIQVLGLGPRGSQKKMEFVINRYTLDYDVKNTVTIPNDSGTQLPFALGGSNVTSTSGVDLDGAAATIPAFGISAPDYNTVNNIIDGCEANGSNCGNGPNVTPGDPMVLTNSNTPNFLQSVANEIGRAHV